jgi:hypothetical protein
MGSDNEMDINIKLERYQQICGTSIRTLTGDARKQALLKF